MTDPGGPIRPVAALDLGDLRPARVRAGSAQPFRGEVAHWELGELLVSPGGRAPALASRTRRMIALREAGYYKAGLLRRRFSKIFKATFGEPPGAYRQQLMPAPCRAD